MLIFSEVDVKSPVTVLRNYDLRQGKISVVGTQRETHVNDTTYYGIRQDKICFVLMQREQLLQYYVTTAYLRKRFSLF